MTEDEKLLPKRKKIIKRNNELDSIQNESDQGMHKKIAILAYQKSENRGFSGSQSDALQDWLEAENELKGVTSIATPPNAID